MGNAGYVGIDVHRRRSVVVRMGPNGEALETTKLHNDPAALAAVLATSGPEAEVVMEATYNWYWAADVVAASGASLHLAHPLGVKGFAYRRLKNDERDATDLADLLRMGRLPEAWVAPPPVRELRELTRHRVKLVQTRSGIKAGVHAVLGKQGRLVGLSDIFGVDGRRRLEKIELDPAYRTRLDSQLRLIDVLDEEVEALDKEIARRLGGHSGYHAIQAIPGVGPVLAGVMVAEIGDVSRFPTPRHLCSWAGLTPRHRESDTKVRRGGITKQGSRLLRWAAVEAACRPGQSEQWLSRWGKGVAERSGSKVVAHVAVARRILTLAFYGLRDGEIRCLVARADG